MVKTKKGKEVDFGIKTVDRGIEKEKGGRGGYLPKGMRGPPISDSGGYCSYGEKEWKVELDDNYNPVAAYVQGTRLNVNYKTWW